MHTQQRLQYTDICLPVVYQSLCCSFTYCGVWRAVVGMPLVTAIGAHFAAYRLVEREKAAQEVQAQGGDEQAVLHADAIAASSGVSSTGGRRRIKREGEGLPDSAQGSNTSE